MKLCVFLIPLAMAAQVTPPVDSWPTYNGDYSGRRFSDLTKINAENVKSLSLAWMYQLSGNAEGAGGRISATHVAERHGTEDATVRGAVCRDF